MNAISFAILQCKLQDDFTLTAVNGMCQAIEYAMSAIPSIEMTAEHIKAIAELVKPQNTGYRQTPVTFANGGHGVHHTLIERAVNNLVDASNNGILTPDEFYYEFERIHPFEDGNGRVGAILWNILSGNRRILITPPNLFTK